jgi:DNA-binding CsgD family transcriptional regulator
MKRSRSKGAALARQDKTWTEREDWALAQTWGKVPCEVIAERLHRTPLAVSRRALIKGLRPKRHARVTADEAAAICEAGAGGERVADIADRLGMSESAVRRALRTGGVELPPSTHEPAPARLWDAAEVELLKAMMRDGEHVPEMARLLGRTRGSVSGKRLWVLKHGGYWG